MCCWAGRPCGRCGRCSAPRPPPPPGAAAASGALSWSKVHAARAATAHPGLAPHQPLSSATCHARGAALRRCRARGPWEVAEASLASSPRSPEVLTAHVGGGPGWAGHQWAGWVVFSFSYSQALGMDLFMTQAATHGQKPANPSSLPAALLGLAVCLPPWWLGPGPVSPDWHHFREEAESGSSGGCAHWNTIPGDWWATPPGTPRPMFRGHLGVGRLTSGPSGCGGCSRGPAPSFSACL